MSSTLQRRAALVRGAALIARGPAATRLASSRLVDDFGVARPLQETAVELLGSPAWPRHLNRLSRELCDRRDHLLGQLAQRLPELVPATIPQGGLHLWLTLPPGLDDVDIGERARPPARPTRPATTRSWGRSHVRKRTLGPYAGSAPCRQRPWQVLFCMFLQRRETAHEQESCSPTHAVGRHQQP